MLHGQNDLLSWIQAGSTIVLVVVTVAYVISTWRILSESTRSSKDAKMPVLLFRSRENEPIQGKQGDFILNGGSGAALDVRLKSNARMSRHPAGGFFIDGFAKGRALKDWELPIDNAIPADNGDPKTQVCFFTSHLSNDILRNPDADFLLTYKDVFGREFSTRFIGGNNKFEIVKKTGVHWWSNVGKRLHR